MPTASSYEATVRTDEKRCRGCGGDVGFLSTCLFCGTTVAPSGPPLAVPLPTGATSTATSVAVAARGAARVVLPDELKRAWERNKEDPGQSRRSSRTGRKAAVRPKGSAPTPVAAPEMPLPGPAPGPASGPVSVVPALPAQTPISSPAVLPHRAAARSAAPAVLPYPAAAPSPAPVVLPYRAAPSAGPKAFALARFGSPVEAPKGGLTATRRVPDEWIVGPKRSRRLAVVNRSGLVRGLAIVLALIAVVGGVIALTASSPSGLQSARVPQRYDTGGWSFTAAFPSAPSVMHFASSLGGKPYTVTLYSAVSGNSDMVVGVYPFPVGKATMSARTFVSREMTGARRSPVSVRLRPGTSTTVQGLPSVAVANAFDGGSTASLGVIILDGHVAYEIVVTGPSSTVRAALRQALSTFRIVDPARGIVAL